jgi:phosphoribosylanthranilate isomerase
MNRVQIKICGVTNVADASLCAELGVDMIGLNFYPQSPRAIDRETARAIIEGLPRRVKAVGVFVDEPADEIRAAARSAGLRTLQLYGETSPQMCRELACEFRVIRGFYANGDFHPEIAALFPECDILLDAHHPKLRGGTGQTCDWSLAAATRDFARFLILSGGLNAQNISTALAAVRPHAVDVCSSVEATPGIKDHQAIKKFVETVRAQ